MVYDIVGDVHGQWDKLAGLLRQLGYTQKGVAFAPPPNTQAVFLGDIIDYGPQQIQTLQTVFAMIDQGFALATMGNHEYNAIAYATKDAKSGLFLRPHTPKNTAQHRAFLEEIDFGGDAHRYWISRLFELPLWLETDAFCAVHACWHTPSMRALDKVLHKQRLCPKRFAHLHNSQKTALNTLLKNPDRAWWQNAAAPKKPVFIGHYWLKGKPAPLTDWLACVDYSAGGDGFLSAYRLDDAPLPKLSANRFCQFLG